MSAGIQAWRTQRTQWFCTNKSRKFLESSGSCFPTFLPSFVVYKFRGLFVQIQRVLSDLHAWAVRTKRSVSGKTRLLTRCLFRSSELLLVQWWYIKSNQQEQSCSHANAWQSMRSRDPYCTVLFPCSETSIFWGSRRRAAWLF